MRDCRPAQRWYAYPVACLLSWPGISVAQEADVPVRLRLDGNLRVPRSVPVAPPQRPAAPLKLVQSAQPEGEVSARPASPDAPAAPPPAPAVTRSAPQSYVDQVLDDSPLVITGAGASGKADEEVKGRRFLSVDYRLYARNASDVGHSVEQGAVLRYPPRNTRLRRAVFRRRAAQLSAGCRRFSAGRARWDSALPCRSIVMR